LLLLVLLAVGCGGEDKGETGKFDFAAFRAPVRSVRPWVRWWWPGNDVLEQELRRELKELAAAGFGGAEIQPLVGALDPLADDEELARRLSVDTPQFYAHVGQALDEAARQGLEIDLNLGSGWPSGGRQVPVEDSLKTLIWSEQTVQGPAEVALALGGPSQSPFYEVAAMIGGSEIPAVWLPELAVLETVLAARVVGGQRTEDLFDLKDQVRLDPDSVVELTSQVDAGGHLAWSVPGGTWQVIVFYRMPDGESPVLAAQPEAGFVMDHFDPAEVLRNLEYLAGSRTGLDRSVLPAWRGLFVDSFEFKVERFFAADFRQQFAARRGYDITPLLPAVLVPGADNNLFDGLAAETASAFKLTDQDERIAWDYQLTASELFIERFVETMQEWSEGKELATRMQPYGAAIDVIRAAGTVAIPEAEQLYAGGPELFLKLLSSGAHLYGRNLVSAESMVWMQQDHSVTPARVVASLNKLFAAGINHVVYHGFPYRKLEGYGEAGWSAFSSPASGYGTYSENFSETWPFWQDFPQLNDYAARCQLALRAGQPEADLLVYYPWLGFPAAFFRLEEHWETLFNGRLEAGDWAELDPGLQLLTTAFGKPEMGPRGDWLVALRALLDQLHRLGWAWDWINEHSLLATTFEDGRLLVRGRPYRALLLYDLPHLTAEAAARLEELAAAGAPIIVVGQLPLRQPGYANWESGDADVATRLGRAAQGEKVRIASPEQVAQMLAEAGLQPGLEFASGGTAVRHARRALGGAGRLFFFWNPERTHLQIAVKAAGGCQRPHILDPWTGRLFLGSQAGEFVSLELAEFGVALLLCNVAPDALVEEAPGSLEPVAEAEILGWTLEVVADDVPDGAVTLPLEKLLPWSEIEPLKHSGGPGAYSANVELEALDGGRRLLLDLGRVEGVARVMVNGKEAGRLIAYPFVTDITALSGPGSNRVDVVLEVPRRNRLIGKALAGDPTAAQFAKKGDLLVPVGLLGPVRLLTAAGPPPH
jgi:hypothetical protein